MNDDELLAHVGSQFRGPCQCVGPFLPFGFHVDIGAGLAVQASAQTRPVALSRPEPSLSTATFAYG